MTQQFTEPTDPDFGYLDAGEFEGELFLSTDGKNTVHVKANTQEGRAAGLKWAKEVYEGLRDTYGTKQSLNKQTYDPKVMPASQPQLMTRPCTHEGCQGTQTFRSGVSKKNNKPWKAWMCDLSKEHTDWQG